MAVIAIIFGVLGVVCTPVGLLVSLAPSMFPTDQQMNDSFEQNPEMQQQMQPQMEQLEEMREMTSSPGYRAWTILSTVVGFILSCCLLAAGIGMLKLRPWAWKLAVGWSVAGLILAVINFIASFALMGPSAAFGVLGFIIGLILPIIMLVVMMQQNVKAAFFSQTPPPPPPEPGV
jgi:uncharacterized protein YneF (UPF0154 family)